MHLFRHGIYSFFEIAYRGSILYANLREAPSRRIYRSSAYEGLDPSEKGAISYFLGLTMAKAFAETRLTVSWLMHLDVYRQDVDVQLLGAKRPDLIGESASGGWVVIESKGRSNSLRAGILNKAKGQASQVVTVNGMAPQYAIGLVAHFTDAVLTLDLEDPEADGKSEGGRDHPRPSGASYGLLSTDSSVA